MGCRLHLWLSIENALLTLAERNHEILEAEYGIKIIVIPWRIPAANKPAATISTCGWLLSGSAVGGLYALIRCGHSAFQTARWHHTGYAVDGR